MIRYQGNKVKKYFYFLLVILFTANVFGCTKQIGNDSVTDRKIQEDGKESIYKRLYHIGEALCKYVPKEYSYFYNGEGTVRMQTFQMHKKILTGFDDSGSAHPTYANETYAWEYTTNSLKTAALFANYDYVTCDANQLVKTDANGKRTVIYQGNGYGNIWIVNERMYLYRNNSKENKERELFSLNMQGKDEHAYGDYEVHAVYDKYLVLTNSEETEIHVMDTETEDIQLLEADAQYLYTDDDTVYFTEHPKDTDEHIVLASVKLDATERCRLADVRKEDVNQIIQTSANLYINCVQAVQDTVYFSCGTYGGSASVYQGGVLAKVKKMVQISRSWGKLPLTLRYMNPGKS